MNHLNRIHTGDFPGIGYLIPDASVDAVITSPPYALQRSDHYGGVAENDYPAWTVAWMAEARRMLKPAGGNVVIVISPHVEARQTSLYVMRTVLALVEDGWQYCQEAIWHKPNSMPTGSIRDLRRAYENVLVFSLDAVNAYTDTRVTGRWSKRIGVTATKKSVAVGVWKSSSIGRKTGITRATNAITAAIGNDKSGWNNHPAQFSEALTDQLVQIYSPIGGVVCDPFIGSGTTALSAIRHRRQWVGFERKSDYVKIAERRIKARQHDPASGDFFVWQNLSPLRQDEVEQTVEDIAALTKRKRPGRKANEELHEVVKATASANPSLSLRQIAEVVEQAGFTKPDWSTVQRILARKISMHDRY